MFFIAQCSFWVNWILPSSAVQWSSKEDAVSVCVCDDTFPRFFAFAFSSLRLLLPSADSWRASVCVRRRTACLCPRCTLPNWPLVVLLPFLSAHRMSPHFGNIITAQAPSICSFGLLILLLLPPRPRSSATTSTLPFQLEHPHWKRKKHIKVVWGSTLPPSVRPLPPETSCCAEHTLNIGHRHCQLQFSSSWNNPFAPQLPADHSPSSALCPLLAFIFNSQLFCAELDKKKCHWWALAICLTYSGRRKALIVFFAGPISSISP